MEKIMIASKKERKAAFNKVLTTTQDWEANYTKKYGTPTERINNAMKERLAKGLPIRCVWD